jgi:hypothetical protein
VFVAQRRDIESARTFFTTALIAHGEPDEIITDFAQALETVAAGWPVTFRARDPVARPGAPHSQPTSMALHHRATPPTPKSSPSANRSWVSNVRSTDHSSPIPIGRSPLSSTPRSHVLAKTLRF